MVKGIVIGALALVLLAAALTAALPFLVNTRSIQAWAAQSASHALGRPVRFASLSIAALPLPTVRLESLEIAEDPAFGPGPFMTVREGRLGIRLRPLLSGRVELSDLTLEEPRVAVIQDPRGRLNVASLGVPGAAGAGPPRSGAGRTGGLPIPTVLLSRVRIVHGALDYRKLGEAPSFRLEQVHLVARQDAAGQPVRVDGEARGEPGGVRFRIKHATLSPGASHQVGDTAIAATVDLDARELSALGEALIGSTGLSGELTGSVDLAGRPARLSATGILTIPRLTIPSHASSCGDRTPRPLALENLRIPLHGDLMQLDSAPAQATAAGGTIALNATVALPPQGIARLRDIAIRHVELAPLLVEHLCQPYGLTGRVDLEGDATLRLADPWRSAAGSGRFRIGPGRVVGAEVVNLVRDVAGLAVVPAIVRDDSGASRSPLDFDSITGSYTIANGIARTEDLVYRARDVTVKAAGTYGLADRRVAMEVTLSEGGNRVAGFVSGAPGSLRVVPMAVRLQDARDVRKFLGRLFR